MTSSRREIDLDQLARPESAATTIAAPKRRWLWWSIPLLLVAGFGWVFYDAVKDLLADPVSVTVVRPRMAESQPKASGKIVFQAAGWIEPDPYPIRVTALAEGVVKVMLKDEADAVKAGEAVCELIREDADLGVSKAEAEHARALAHVAKSRAERDNSKESFAAALAVSEAHALALAELDGKNAELAMQEAAAKKAEASVRVAKLDLSTLEYLQKNDAIGPWQVELSAAKVDEAQSSLDTLLGQVAHIKAQVRKAQVRLKRSEDDLKFRFEERLRVEEAEAGLSDAEAHARLTNAALAEAKLRAERMVVKSPSGGVVLSRDAVPGAVVGPGMGGASLLTLYDPKALRVRVDVPQAQVSGASVGQRAEIRCDVRRNRPYAGRVLRIIDTADIQKVTLEVQVRITNPDGLLKPDMLCQVSVFHDGDDSGAEAAPVTSTLAIPARCLQPDGSVWVVAGDGRTAERRAVEAQAQPGASEVMVTRGLNLSDKVIDQGVALLTPGIRIKVRGEP